jgi:hypothetical protein
MPEGKVKPLGKTAVSGIVVFPVLTATPEATVNVPLGGSSQTPKGKGRNSITVSFPVGITLQAIIST